VGLSHARPAFGIDSVLVGGEEVAVTERAAHVTPFGTLLHFAKDSDVAQPPVLLVAPMSGHFSTLLRATVADDAPEHDVYLTDCTTRARSRSPRARSASTATRTTSSSFLRVIVPART
jgi:poly-beta-hydroxyalkanoate depolymerase